MIYTVKGQGLLGTYLVGSLPIYAITIRMSRKGYSVMKIKYVGGIVEGLTYGKVYTGYPWPHKGGATIEVDDCGNHNVALFAGEWEEA